MSARHTPGPWRWEFNAKGKDLHLVGGRPQYDLTVMDFQRWGMGGATMRLRDPGPDGYGMQLLYRLHERKDWVTPFPGREHHAHWCAGVTHPDALLIAAAPELLEALEMVRDADDDCRRDGLSHHRIPMMARAKIDAALNKATGASS